MLIFNCTFEFELAILGKCTVAKEAAYLGQYTTLSFCLVPMAIL